ncbi:MAG: thiamine-phosphate kinase, partial [Chloroflexi bacterium]
TLVDGVHFLQEFAPWADVGWRALAVNISDIAAMGGEPLFALVTLALPAETPVAVVDDLYAGLSECAHEYGVTIAGGDIVRAPQVSLTIALMGQAQMRAGEPLLMRRDGARPGDFIAVTGVLGESAAGLQCLKEGAQRSDPLVMAHLRPRPPLTTGQEAARLEFKCAIDISDGLLQDLGHVCRASDVGARIRGADIPVSHEVRRREHLNALRLACSGGEDYQLVLVGPPAKMRALEAARVPVKVIGKMFKGKPAVSFGSGPPPEVSLNASGWDHLHSG